MEEPPALRPQSWHIYAVYRPRKELKHEVIGYANIETGTARLLAPFNRRLFWTVPVYGLRRSVGEHVWMDACLSDYRLVEVPNMIII